ncbi:MAG: AMP-binding protein [Burkholderiales bacterium]|jgi:fatty-acyl-CoA synthase
MPHLVLYDGCTVGHMFRRAIERGGDRIAFVDDDTVLTYRQLGARLSGIVQALEARGLARGDAVATLSDNRVDANLVTAAANTMGVRSTAMHPLGSAADHAYILSDGVIGTLVFDPAAHGDRARLLAERAPGLRLLALGPSPLAPDLLADAASRPPGPLVPRAAPEDVANLTYTGGTSGRPKSVMTTHRVRVTMVMSELAEWDWPAEPRFLAITPITHAAGAIVLPVREAVKAVVVLRPGMHVEAAELIALVREAKGSVQAPKSVDSWPRCRSPAWASPTRRRCARRTGVVRRAGWPKRRRGAQ